MEKEIVDMLTIDQFSPVPFYFQLYSEFKRLLENKKLHPGDKLPTENGISDKLSLSRVIVRRAFEELEKEGLITRKKAIGTYVNDDIIVTPSKNNYGWMPITTTIEMNNKKPSIMNVSLDLINPPSDIQKWFKISAKKKISVLKRVYSADGVPVVLIHFYLIPEIEWHMDLLGTGSLTQYLEKYHNIRAINSYSRTSAEKPTRECAKLLQISPKDPVLKVKALNLGIYGEPIGGDISYFNSAKIEIAFKIGKYHPIKWVDIK